MAAPAAQKNVRREATTSRADVIGGLMRRRGAPTRAARLDGADQQAGSIAIEEPAIRERAA
jgi:hypothetical protein